jgi:hypothetical protein
MDWTLFDYLLAAALLTGAGVLLKAVARRPEGIAYTAGTVGLGVAAMVLGETDDAPGLVLFGLLLIGVTVALRLRATQRNT